MRVAGSVRPSSKLTISLLCALAACGEVAKVTDAGASGPSAGKASAAPGGGTTPAEGLYGAFTLRLVAQTEASGGNSATPAQTAFIGSLTDGEIPIPNSWIKSDEANDCVLYIPKSPFCDPSCGSSAVCVSDDTCVDRPKAQTVGTIHLKGVRASEVNMTAVANNYQPAAGTALPYPPCAEGDEVSLAADGGTYRGFTLSARCIAPLEFAGPVAIVKATPLKLVWEAPKHSDLARIAVRLDISHHGGSRGKIECDTADSGSLEIPAAMMDKLVALGVAGFPTVIVTRIMKGGTTGSEPTHVALNIQQSVEREIQLDGLMSCSDDNECPAPKKCQSDLTCK